MSDLGPVFAELRTIMRPYAAKLETKTDSLTTLYIDTRYIQKNQKPLFFGAVQIKQHYVSYHLMPVYVEPKLLEGISPELMHRMQGKSCFNFVKVDKLLFKELAALTNASFAAYKKRGFV